MIDTPFVTIREAATATGLSQKFLREGVKNGSIPFLRVGNRYMILLPEMLKRLEMQCYNLEVTCDDETKKCRP